jgi:trimethylamine--corrinoid protein Co-methyltransferase
MGICGADQGASIEQLIIDNETAGYVKRIMRGFTIDKETLGLDVIRQAGIGGNYLTEEHTLNHFRKELWFSQGFNRESWEPWAAAGAKSMVEWAVDRKKEILKEHKTTPMAPELAAAVDAVVDQAKHELLNT